jgi:hypothetical protein
VQSSNLTTQRRALPTLRQLAFLVEFSGRSNFRVAARAQFIIESTMSTRIKELERAQWWKFGIATPSATTAIRVIGQRGATQASRGVGGSQRGQTAATPSAPSGRCLTLAELRPSMSR